VEDEYVGNKHSEDTPNARQKPVNVTYRIGSELFKIFRGQHAEGSQDDKIQKTLDALFLNVLDSGSQGARSLFYLCHYSYAL
jgi:hypothetical protein